MPVPALVQAVATAALTGLGCLALEYVPIPDPRLLRALQAGIVGIALVWMARVAGIV